MLLDDVQEFLQAYGVESPGWTIYKGFLPDESDTAIAIYETPGMTSDTMGGENENLSFQVRVRAGKLDYPIARDKWGEIFELLDGAKETDGSPVLLRGYVFILPVHQGPAAFNDSKARPNMTSNWRVKKLKNV